MTIAQTDQPTPQRPLRLWPGVALAVLQLLALFILPIVFPDDPIYGLFGFVLGGLFIILWWVFFSRAPWSDRLGAVIMAIIALYATSWIIHVSVAGAAMGRMFLALAIPTLSFVFAVAVAASHRLSDRPRRAVMCATILLASGGWALVRFGGIGGSGSFDFAWRWSKTPEERLLAQAHDEPVAALAAPAAAETPKEAPVAKAGEKPPAVPATPPTAKNKPAAPAAVETAAEWPGFRGPHRDGIIPGVRIETDWSKSPPVKLWQRPIGPGWSSFAIHGDLLYTQEQRGDHEIVSCYNMTTGKPVWMHRDATRFWEANGGTGPRGTPTLSNGRVYTFGATGIVNALDAGNGAMVWTRNAASDTGAKLPGWGFSSSPLVVGDVVIVAASGSLIAYDLATGNPRWKGPRHGTSYSSPHLLTIDGVAQVLLMSGTGATSIAPADGKVLWEHAFPTGGRIVQPALTADGDILMTVGDEGMGGAGLASLAIAHGTVDGKGGWTVKERWTTRGLKPNFNDFVIHKGHAYGFDGNILSCIDLKDGTRKWKGGRYGSGQLVLLADQDVLLVLSEQGELALVSATPGQYTELAKFPAIEGKTWNHPALVGDVLLVRNDQEMAVFRLPLADAKKPSSLGPP